MRKSRLLVIGNGMAGLRFLEEVVALAPGRFDITAIGEEPEPAYNRVLLSPLLAGEICPADVAMKPRYWYAANGIKLTTGVSVSCLDAQARCATISGGHSIDFDVCVLATGSAPVRLPVTGGDLAGVEVFRTTADIERLTFASKSGCGVVVIGGGLLGIEAAYGLKRAGAHVTLLHLMDRLMERQLDRKASEVLKSALETKGIEVFLSAETAAISGNGSAEKLILRDGREISAALVVMAIGIRPNSALAAAAGIACNRGIIVDDCMQTSVSGIYAIGECAEHRGTVYGLVEPVYEHARVAAHTVCGLEAEYSGTVLATNLKVSGVPVFSAGDYEGIVSEHIILKADAAGSYRKFVVRDGRLAGVVLVGDTTDALWYRDLIRTGKSISSFRSTLAFGRAYAEAS
jgi:nitrite reductase (NADH) large subunit